MTTKPRAVIFDIDDVLCESRESILAHLKHCQEAGRGDDNFHAEHWDDWEYSHLEPIRPWISLLNCVSEDVFVILVTSRAVNQRAGTETWLNKHHINFDDLIMWDEKESSYHEHKGQVAKRLLGEYTIEVAIDDSQSHCEAYREAGVPFIHVHRDALK